ncbi:ubiquinone oxidoreductase 20 kd subunit [Russula ochroleuca]|uniref:Ubiquinone oxidoreductase 20 kd subunit n=1 Tax=Russula ochroleuca TaxID=152965 RepID=A0A9P5MYK0_9AGAM|nr:ubiquinone oxidoreductase 20 kd subunit [Russula ochroleuca]
MLSARLAAAARLRPAFARLSSSSSSVSSSSQAVPTEAAKPIPAVVPQSPNHAATWSTNQHPRPAGQSGPRFEQTIMELQPNSLSAMELIANEPIRLIHSRKAVCDGGAGPLGHPKIYINLDKPGPQSCGYCGLRFEQASHHGHEH